MLSRQLRPWMAGLALTAILAAACGPTTPVATQGVEPTEAPVATEAPGSTEAAPTEAPTEAAAPTAAPSGAESTLVYASNIDDLISLDPAVVYEFSGILAVHQVYETLVKFEGADLSTLKPGLAESWEVTDAGDTWQLTFKLKEGVTFASGNPLTSEDVVYSFQRVLAINGSPAFLFTDVAQLTPEGITAPDAQTVVITQPKTASPQSFLSILTYTIGGIVDSVEVKAHEVDGDYGAAWLLDHSAGSGPYQVDHWDKTVEVLLTANPNYGGEAPKLSSILFKHVPESANQQIQLEQGDVDIAQNLSPEQLAAIQGKEGLATTSGDSLLLFYVGMNATVAPLDKPQVREALRMAIDYDGIINGLISGNGKKVQTIIPAGLLGYNEDAPFQKDVEGAKALLAEAGVPDGFDIEMLVPAGAASGGIAWADLAAKLQADWAEIGVNVNIKQVEFAELLTSYRAQQGQLVLVIWGPDFPDPDANVGPFTNIDAGSIAYRNAWDDSIKEQAAAAAIITDPAERAAAYAEITDYVLHNGPYAVLYQVTQLFGLRSNVQGFAWNPMGYADLWNVSK